MESSEKRGPAQLADSPWLWLLVFSGMALFAIAVIHGKYNRRQAGIELRSQARDATVHRESGKADARVEEPPTATSLGAIVAVLAILAILSAAQLFIQFGRKRLGRSERRRSDRSGR